MAEDKLNILARLKGLKLYAGLNENQLAQVVEAFISLRELSLFSGWNEGQLARPAKTFAALRETGKFASLDDYRLAQVSKALWELRDRRLFAHLADEQLAEVADAYVTLKEGKLANDLREEQIPQAAEAYARLKGMKLFTGQNESRLAQAAVAFILLRELSLFRDLSEEQLAHVARVVRLVTLSEKKTLTLDEDKDYPFFTVLDGGITQRYSQGKQSKVAKLKRGDFFGADILFTGRRQQYSIVAEPPAQPSHQAGKKQVKLLSINVEQLRPLVQAYTTLRDNLKAQYNIYRTTRSRHFDWLREDETVLLIRRKHPAYLLVMQILPVLAMWAGLIILLFAASIEFASFHLAVQWFGMAVLGGAVLWAVWRYLDWYNDYYLVTDIRVVWLERVIGLYDSRQEVRLTAVKSEETKASFIGRQLGYGDLIVQAFMGQVVFRQVADPVAIKELVEKQRKSAGERQGKLDKTEMEQVIRGKIEPPPIVQQRPPQQSAKPVAGEANKIIRPQGLWERISGFFQTRIEEGDTVTYRKHLFILLTKTWLPALAILGVILLTGFLYWQRVNGRIEFPSALAIVLSGMLVVIMPALWWLYNYVDWRNDIYRITPDKIIDSERKPLGDEITKSAPLENVLSLDYERLGLLGILMNFGNVIVNVGTESKFIFYNIHDPARAQRDIFDHMYDLRLRKQHSEAAQEWERASDWLAAYHRQAEEMRRAQNSP